MKKNKHDHKATDCLKVGLFTAVMIAPIIAVLSTTTYMAFNENAELPEQTETRIVEVAPQTNEVNSIEDLIVGNWYYYNNQIQGDYDILTDEWIYVDIYDYSYYRKAYNDPEAYELTFSDIEDMALKEFYFKWNNMYNIMEDLPQKAPSLELIPSKYETQEIQIQTNGNAFYYACEELQNQPLFNWTTETAIYSTLNAMTSGLSIHNGILPLLLSYWFLMTVIYIVADIIIECFKAITHMIVRA